VKPHVNNHSAALITALLLFFLKRAQLLLAEINEYYNQLLNMLGNGSNAYCFLV
jgi:hypothetical protein